MSDDLPNHGEEWAPRRPTADEVIERLERLWASEPDLQSDHGRRRSRSDHGASSEEPGVELFSELANRLVDHITAGSAADFDDTLESDAEIADLLRKAFTTDRPADESLSVGNGFSLDGNRRWQLGEFRILREIGRGGMGIVYEAEQLSLGRRVALKVLPFAALLGKAQLNRFKNEARAAATLDHPNIVAIYSVGTDQGVHYYAMQLVEGCSLAQLIARMRNEERNWNEECGMRNEETVPLEAMSTQSSGTPRRFFRTVAELGAQAARALDHAHANGVLHRDVKPANLLVDDTGKLWVTDFGLARIVAAPEMTTTGDVLGTLGYMSPEQALGHRSEVGERSDIYSLGATLYELATLRPLFGHVDRSTLLHAIAHRDPLRPRTVRPEMPRDLETILLKATAKEPAHRYASAQEMANDLERFCRNQTIRARRPTIIDQIGKWSRRHQALVITLVVALAVVTLISAASAVLINHARGSAREAQRLAEENAERLGDLLYSTDIQLAYEDWDKGWPDQARLVLERQRPAPGETDRRGIEWQLLENLTRTPTSFALVGHDGPVAEVAPFPDGRRAASVGEDGTLRVWDVRSRRLAKAFPLGDKSLQAVAVSSDGRYVAASSHRLHLVDVDGREVRELFETDATIESLAFLEDDRAIAVGSRYLQVDVVSREGELLTSIASGARHESLQFLPTHRALVIPSRSDAPGMEDLGLVELRSDDLSKVLRTWNPHDYENSPYGDFVMAAVSPCERFLACGDRYNGRFAIFDLRTGDQVAIIAPLRSRMTSIAYSPDGSSLSASFESGSVRIWRLQPRGEESLSLDPLAQVVTAHEGEATCVRYLDARTLVTAGEDGAVRVWDLGHQERILRLGQHDGAPFDLCFSPDGTRLATACNDEFAIYNSHDGSRLFYQRRARRDFCEVEWTPDGRRVMVASPHSGHVELFDLAKQEFDIRFEHNEHIDDIALSPSGRELASIGGNELRIWDLESSRELGSYQLPDDGYVVEYSPSGRWLAYAGRLGRVILRDTKDRRVELELPCLGDTNCLAFSRDEAMLISGHQDSKIRIWDLAAGTMTAELSGHERPVHDVVLLGDDGTLASASADGTLRLWNLKMNRPVGVVHRCLHVRSVDVSSAGRQLAAGVSYDDGRRVVVVFPLSAQ